MRAKAKKTRGRPKKPASMLIGTSFDNTPSAIEPDRRRLLRRREHDKSGNILKVAEGLVYGERNKTYGHPTENFDNIAGLWNVYFNAIKKRPKVAAGMEAHCFEINNIDVAYLNILQKIARGATNQEHIDTVVDIAGYASTIERILQNK